MLNARTIGLKLEFHLLKKDGAPLRRLIPARWQAAMRRRARAKYLLWDGKPYRAWIENRLRERRALYACQPRPGLLSILTAVWDGTPLKYFRSLAESIISQNGGGATQWVIVDNGCRNRELRAFLDRLARYEWVAIRRLPENAGIVGGLRACLEAAAGRYVLTVDADDWLYPDCLQVVTHWVERTGFPPLLYTDEDKMIGNRAVQPYVKPDFDPVLLLNSAYIAHLGVIDRELALKHGAYMDKATEGSPDWDLFVRFLSAGMQAVHIPEVVYSWRMHPESTSDDAGSKHYVHSSQKAVLQRYLNSRGLADKYDVEYSPLLTGSADWWLRRRKTDAVQALVVTLTTGAPAGVPPADYPKLTRAALPFDAPVSALGEIAHGDLICLVSDDLRIDREDWLWEALGLFERYPDTAMVGGRIRGNAETILSAGQVLGFGSGCGCPDRGRAAIDPGHFTQVMKQRSVSAVSSQFAVLRTSFLRELARDLAAVSIPMLGAWAGARAVRTGRRVIYSPYLSGVSSLDWEALPTAQEWAEFRAGNAAVMPDRRYYPEPFGMRRGSVYSFSGGELPR